VKASQPQEAQKKQTLNEFGGLTAMNICAFVPFVAN
jgi:hypothetical protein